MDNEVKVGGIYRHFKGHYYRVLGIALHTETEENLVIYSRLLDDALFARPVWMFLEDVDHEKYPHTTQKKRFELQN